MGEASSGKKGRKFGRHSRGNSMKTYNAVRRDLRNKAKKITKHEKAVAKAQVKQTKVPRGTTRANRRGNPCTLI